MAYRSAPDRLHRRRLSVLTATAAMAVLAAGCARTERLTDIVKLPGQTEKQTATAAAEPARDTADPLRAATGHWAQAHARNPKDPEAAVNYALNLRASGASSQALAVLAKAHEANPSHARLSAEYGRLALEAGDIKLAERLLNAAEKGQAKPDWRFLSAKGTLHAKLGEPAAAQKYYQAALRQKPDSLPTMNNLALSYALDGKAAEAEALLRQVVAKGGDDRRMRQNLALVLGLQGKFDEGQQLAQAGDLPTDQANANMAFLRNMVRRPESATAVAQDAPSQAAPTATATAAVAAAARPARGPLEAWAANSAVATPAPGTSAPPSLPARRPEPAPAVSTELAAAARAAPAATAAPSGPAAPAAAPANADKATVALRGSRSAAATGNRMEALPWQTGGGGQTLTAQAGWSASILQEPARLTPPAR